MAPRGSKHEQNVETEKYPYGLVDASICRYLKLKQELKTWRALPTQLDQGIFIRHQSNQAGKFITSFANYMLWGDSTRFENIVNGLKQFFYIGLDNKQFFGYIAVKLEHKPDFSIIMNKKATWKYQTHHINKRWLK